MDLNRKPQDAAVTRNRAVPAPLPGSEAERLLARARALRARTLGRMLRGALRASSEALRADRGRPFPATPAA